MGQRHGAHGGLTGRGEAAGDGAFRSAPWIVSEPSRRQARVDGAAARERKGRAALAPLFERQSSDRPWRAWLGRLSDDFHHTDPTAIYRHALNAWVSPLATCALPKGVCYLLTYLLLTSMCMLLSRDCARRGSSYSTIPYSGPSRRLMRYCLTDMREMCYQVYEKVSMALGGAGAVQDRRRGVSNLWRRLQGKGQARRRAGHVCARARDQGGGRHHVRRRVAGARAGAAHDSIFSGLRHGEYPGTKVTLGPDIPSETATAAAVRRLSSVAVERSPVRPPRLIAAGGLVNLASLYRSKGFEDDATFVDELAQVQTESGIIWVLAASVPRVLELAQKGREGKEAKHNGKSGERTKPASSSSMAPAAVPVHDTGCRVCSKMPDYIYFMWPRSRKG